MKTLSMLALATALAAAPALATPALAANDHMAGHGGMGHGASDAVAGTGTVNTVDAAKRTVNVSHQPIKALGWPKMTMDFAVAEGVDLAALTPGASVDFTLIRGADGIYMVDTIAAK